VTPEDIHALATPWLKDKRFWATVGATTITVCNHILKLNLTLGELTLIWSGWTAYVAQSQIGHQLKINALAGAADAPEAPAGGDQP